eukprot:13822953-Alexandrium_andersonii.AAC.1
MLDEPKGFNPADVGAGMVGGGSKRHAAKRCELPVRVVRRFGQGVGAKLLVNLQSDFQKWDVGRKAFHGRLWGN